MVAVPDAVAAEICAKLRQMTTEAWKNYFWRSEGLTSLWLKHIMPGCINSFPLIGFQDVVTKRFFESLGHLTSNFFTSNAGNA